ncbi:caspase family protein, partial [Bradyrhizobium sp. 23]|nr:caspase family protein [Bradyrhizobium sp. 23]
MVGLILPAPMSRLQRLAGRVALAIALMLAAATTAQADKRVALVLGVSNYQSVARLANPDSDAAAISDVFKRMGFDIVELRRDLGVIEMRR